MFRQQLVSTAQNSTQNAQLDLDIPIHLNSCQKSVADAMHAGYLLAFVLRYYLFDLVFKVDSSLIPSAKPV